MTVAEGTRLIVMKGSNDNVNEYDFFIRTACTPIRWNYYDLELNNIFIEMCDNLSDNFHIYNINNNNETNENSEIDSNNSNVIINANERKSIILNYALKIFYYWIIFAPLTRGTATCGYAALHSIVLANGYILKSNIPQNIQLDWEAILCIKCNDFIVKVESWFSLVTSNIIIDDIDDSIYFNSIKKMIQSLSVT